MSSTASTFGFSVASSSVGDGLENWQNFLKNQIFPTLRINKNYPMVIVLRYDVDSVGVNMRDKF